MKKKLQKTPASYIKLAAVLIILFGIPYFLFKNGLLTNPFDNETAPNATPTSFPLADGKEAEEEFNWKVLTREEGYEFAYPDSYRGCETDITRSILNLPDRETQLIEVFCPTSSTYMQIISEGSSRDLWDWWYSLQPENEAFFEEHGTYIQIKFVNEDAIQITYPKGENNEHANQVEILFHKNGLNYLLVFPHLACPQDSCWEKNIETQAYTTFRFITDTPTPTKAPLSNNGCVIGGCSGEICADEEMSSDCSYREEYACYKTAVCERQSNGACGWTQTEEFTSCLNSFQ